MDDSDVDPDFIPDPVDEQSSEEEDELPKLNSKGEI